MNWDQLKAVLGLRWQLTRNQWSRSKSGLRRVFAWIVAALSCIAAVGVFAGGIAGGIPLGHARSDALLFTWTILIAVFVFLWLIGLLVELQRSEAIDLQRLIHLPVKLGQVFVINYIASHFSFSLIVAVPAMIGLTIGVAIARGPSMLLVLPLALSMVIAITAWTYCLRGWLASLMANPRRRRSVIAIITVAFVVIAQAPNLYFNVIGRPSAKDTGRAQSFARITTIAKYIPPLWVAVGAKSLADGKYAQALGGTVAFVAIGALGLRRAYGATLRFYRGDDRRAAPTESNRNVSEVRRAHSEFIARKIPGLSNEASAVTLASLRSMSRAPELKMQTAMAFVVTIVLAVTFVFRSHTRLPLAAKPFLLPAVMSFTLLTLAQFLGNQFGFDRDAFQTFVTSPTPRREIVLGRNLAAVPTLTVLCAIWLVLLCVFVRLPLTAVLAGVFQIVSLSLMAAIVGNFISIQLPSRIRAASLKPTKISGLRGVLVLLCQLFSPVLILPILIGPLLELLWNWTGLPINLVYSAIFAVIAAVVYRMSLTAFGNQLQQRETKILEILTTEVE